MQVTFKLKSCTTLIVLVYTQGQANHLIKNTELDDLVFINDNYFKDGSLR